MTEHEKRLQVGPFDAPPDFMDDVLDLSDEQQWARMEEAFEELRDVLKNCRLETRAEAVGRDNDNIDDGKIPYRRTFESRGDGEKQADLIEMSWATARSLIPDLERMLAARDLTVALLTAWGLFNYAGGIVHAAYATEVDDFKQVRSARKGGTTTKAQGALRRRWIAHQLAARVRRGETRQVAEKNVTHRILKLIEDGEDRGDDVSWYAGLLSERVLSATFTSKHLSNAKIARLASEPPIAEWPPLPD